MTNHLPSTRGFESPVLKFDFGYLFRILLAKSWLIVVTVALCLTAAVVYLLLTPKIYESKATIQVEQEGQKVVNFQGVNTEDYKTIDTLKTIEQSLLSETLLVRVVKANGLDKDPAFAPRKKDGSPYLDIELAARFKARVAVSLRRGTRLIDVAVEDVDPKRAQRLAQSMIQEFQDQNFEQKFAVSKSANTFLIAEGERLAEKLRKSEVAVQAYREEHHAVSLEEKQNIVVEKLKELNVKVVDLRSERIKLEADIATIQHSRKSPEDLLLLSSVSSLPAVADLRRQIADKEADFAQLKERYGELHPKYIEAQAQIKDMKQNLNRTLLSSGDQVEKTYEAAKITEGKLLNSLRDQEAAALELNKIAIPYNVLVREVESDRALYESVLRRMKETNLTKNLEDSNIRVIGTPLVAASPVKPSKLKILALAFIAGLVISSGLVIGIDLADSSIRNAEQVEEYLDLPVLAQVPRSKRKHLDREPVLRVDPASHEAEAFRSLRTALSFLGEQKNNKTILFTSATPGEGKTYCSLNCAAALAQQGLRTLIVDADLRRPFLSKTLLAERRGKGLTGCLSGHENLIDCCKPTGVANLSILGAGERVSAPAELLAGEHLGRLLKEASVHFDRVVVDTAPVNAVSDTQLIAREVESVCLVVRAGKTSRSSVIRACNLLARANHHVDAVVLNQVVQRSREDYYLHHYSNIYATANAFRGGHTADGQV